MIIFNCYNCANDLKDTVVKVERNLQVHGTEQLLCKENIFKHLRSFTVREVVSVCPIYFRGMSSSSQTVMRCLTLTLNGDSFICRFVEKDSKYHGYYKNCIGFIC